MITQFRADPHFLTRYHATSFFTLLLANLLLATLVPHSPIDFLWYLPAILLVSSIKIQLVIVGFVYACGVSFFQESFHWSYLLALPMAVLITFPLTGLLHSASHGSIKPKWFNRLVGELSGLIQLSGYAQWRIVHVIHHKHADDPELDPHPPLNKKYWEFTKGMRDSALKAYTQFYMKLFGQTEASVRELKRFGLMAKLDQRVRVLFWYLVLGPQLFSFLFATSIAFKMFHYAWFNYITHRPASTGAANTKYIIKNLNDHVYRFVNVISFGLYYHQNHHLYPLLFDPRSAVLAKEKVKHSEAA